jgi:trans-aconitate methyltransferase
MTERWDPADYHKYSYPQYAFALALVERLRLQGTERILDLGCGDGKVTAELAARVPHGSALGISQPIISPRRSREDHFSP